MPLTCWLWGLPCKPGLAWVLCQRSQATDGWAVPRAAPPVVRTALVVACCLAWFWPIPASTIWECPAITCGSACTRDHCQWEIQTGGSRLPLSPPRSPPVGPRRLRASVTPACTNSVNAAAQPPPYFNTADWKSTNPFKITIVPEGRRSYNADVAGPCYLASGPRAPDPVLFTGRVIAAVFRCEVPGRQCPDKHLLPGTGETADPTELGWWLLGHFGKSSALQGSTMDTAFC